MIICKPLTKVPGMAVQCRPLILTGRDGRQRQRQRDRAQTFPPWQAKSIVKRQTRRANEPEPASSQPSPHGPFRGRKVVGWGHLNNGRLAEDGTAEPEDVMGRRASTVHAVHTSTPGRTYICTTYRCSLPASPVELRAWAGGHGWDGWLAPASVPERKSEPGAVGETDRHPCSSCGQERTRSANLAMVGH